MAQNLMRGRYMKPISEHILKGHIQALRQIFGQTFEAPDDGNFVLRSYFAGSNLQIAFENGPLTASIKTDRSSDEACALLVETGGKKIRCSFFESWEVLGRKSASTYRFDAIGMTFFLSIKKENQELNKQIFRLEWEDWQHPDRKNKAAYPHWQFDRWLTASAKPDDETLAELRKSLEGTEPSSPAETPPVFETAEQALGHQAPEDRPDLRWFTKLHFPSIAPWATDPIKTLDSGLQPHRRIPDSVTELERWVKSSLLYLKNEIETYAV